jgi:hypothetical protein
LVEAGLPEAGNGNTEGVLRPRISLLVVAAYLIVGAFVAASHHYFAHGGLRGIASAVLAILLWPLVLLGLNIRIGK